MMDNAINIYQEAIAKNSVIQAQLSNSRLSIQAVNELVQEIEAIFLPQYPNAIAHPES